MNTRTAVLLFVGACLVACGGKIATESEPSSTLTPAQGTQGPGSTQPVITNPGNPSFGGRPHPTPSSSCTFDGTSASSSGADKSFSCMSESDFTCNGELVSITCSCASSQDGQWQPGTCTCGSNTFAFDCSGGCNPTAPQFAACNLPYSDSGGSSFGSSSSTSG